MADSPSIETTTTFKRWTLGPFRVEFHRYVHNYVASGSGRRFVNRVTVIRDRR